MTANWLASASLIGGVLTIALLALFLIPWLREPRRLGNGVRFTLFFGMFLLELAFLIFNTANQGFIVVMGVLFVMIVLAVMLVLLFLWLLLLWNAVIVWKRESHTLANMLTLFLGIGLILVWVLNLVALNRFLPQWLNVLLSGVPFIAFYLITCSYNFLLNVVLYQFVPRRYHANYLIVLGAGLINGDQVSRLLGARIERALAFSAKQVRKGRPAPKIIFSGGQGPDEKSSEAWAMAKYAVAHGLDPQLVLLEDRSRTTLENMEFSKKVIARDSAADAQPQVKFFTNNYHTFRAGLFARQAGLAANGVGAKTRLYFLPNALIREFVAVLIMNKKRHFWMLLIGIVLIMGVTGVSTLISSSPAVRDFLADFFRQFNFKF